MTVGSAMQSDPPILHADTTVLSVVSALRARPAGAVIIVDEVNRAVGLVEADDIVQRVVFEAQPSLPVSQIMQGAAALCSADDLLYHQVARLHREGRRILGVVDQQGRPAGLLRTGAALAPLIEPIATFITTGEAAGAEGRAALAACFTQDGHDALDVQRALADLNDALMRRSADQALAGMAADGWPAPPARFALIVMGSGGRRESFLNPDQDNGLILDAYPSSAQDTVEAYFAEFASRVARALDQEGYPLCPGNVMATNRLWRRTLEDWIGEVGRWAWQRSGQAVLSADIFLDFRAIQGDWSLGQRLREAVNRICVEDPAFLRQISWQEARHSEPIGMFRQIIADGDDHGVPYIDLKLRGTLPLVNLVRILALRHGIEATGTGERIVALHQGDHISDSLQSALMEDFAVLTRMRLGQQLADLAAGRPVGNRLRLDTLTDRDKAHLVQVFRTIELLRKVAAQEFGGYRG